MPITLSENADQFRWLNEPDRWSHTTYLEVQTRPDTDFWQRTHYGFRRDNGHLFATSIQGDFTATAQVEFLPTSQYDQCGLMCRVDSDTWIKCSVEYETPALSRLGSVVTNLGYSDWATQDAPYTNVLWYAMSRRGPDILLEWALEGQVWHQMRIAPLHGAVHDLKVGFYACSPVGSGFVCRLHELTIDHNRWLDSHAEPTAT